MRDRKIALAVVLTAVVCIASLSSAFAQEEQAAQENKVAKFFKSIISWPFTITKQAGKTVANTTETGVNTVVNTGTSVAETVTGKPEKIKDVVVVPVKGSAETGYVAVEGSVRTPVDGTKEAFK